MEEQFILRVPPSVAEQIERLMNESVTGSSSNPDDASLDLSFAGTPRPLYLLCAPRIQLSVSARNWYRAVGLRNLGVIEMGISWRIRCNSGGYLWENSLAGYSMPVRCLTKCTRHAQ